MGETIYSLRKQISNNNHKIELYGWDVIGSDAASNVDKMNELRQQNEWLRSRIKRKQRWNKWLRRFKPTPTTHKTKSLKRKS